MCICIRLEWMEGGVMYMSVYLDLLIARSVLKDGLSFSTCVGEVSEGKCFQRNIAPAMRRSLGGAGGSLPDSLCAQVAGKCFLSPSGLLRSCCFRLWLSWPRRGCARI